MGKGFALEPAVFPAVSVDSLAVISPPMRSALKLLAQSHDFALAWQRDGWDFAVEIDLLRSRHLNNNDFRWLVCKGYVEHAREISLAEEDGRRFSFEGALRFSTQSCFILTPAGAAFVEQVLNPSCAAGGNGQSGTETRRGGHPVAPVPAWHAPRIVGW